MSLVLIDQIQTNQEQLILSSVNIKNNRATEKHLQGFVPKSFEFRVKQLPHEKFEINSSRNYCLSMG